MMGKVIMLSGLWPSSLLLSSCLTDVHGRFRVAENTDVWSLKKG